MITVEISKPPIFLVKNKTGIKLFQSMLTFYFYTPCKSKKTKGFLSFLESIEIKHWGVFKLIKSDLDFPVFK